MSQNKWQMSLDEALKYVLREVTCLTCGKQIPISGLHLMYNKNSLQINMDYRCPCGGHETDFRKWSKPGSPKLADLRGTFKPEKRPWYRRLWKWWMRGAE